MCIPGLSKSLKDGILPHNYGVNSHAYGYLFYVQSSGCKGNSRYWMFLAVSGALKQMEGSLGLLGF